MARTQAEIDRENRRYESEIEGLKELYAASRDAILKSEDIAGETLVAVSIIIDAIIALILLPDPTVSKVLAVCGIAGLSIFMAYYVYKAVSAGSKKELLAWWARRKKALEDALAKHEQVLLDP